MAKEHKMSKLECLEQTIAYYEQRMDQLSNEIKDKERLLCTYIKDNMTIKGKLELMTKRYTLLEADYRAKSAFYDMFGPKLSVGMPDVLKALKTANLCGLTNNEATLHKKLANDAVKAAEDIANGRKGKA